jgi:thioredoxin reductase (NADPH)
MNKADVVVVGAGPAGLSAALYAARFCRSTLVLHDGTARAARIPLTHNAPGFQEGIAGPDLIERMTRHATNFGAKFAEAHVASATRADGAFELHADDGRTWTARALILATGVTMNQIPIDERLHELALKFGVLRYCPVCDGYEHRGKRIAVVGCDVSGAAEALFLRQYSTDVTLLPQHTAELTDEERQDLASAGIRTLETPVASYEPVKGAMRLLLEGESKPHEFGVLYAALGTRPRNRLAKSLGLPVDDDGKVGGDAPFGTDVEGLFCAGDLVHGLDQISVAMGQGAIAATRAHNWLREQDGHTVEAVLDTD